LVRFAQQTGVHASPVRIATKLVHLHPRKTPVVHELCGTDREAKANFANWYLHAVKHEGEYTPRSFCFVMNGFISEDT
jgi:hypothetical protein